MSATRLIVFRDLIGEWRWYKLGTDGLVVKDSGQGFGTKAEALRSVLREAGDRGHIEIDRGTADETPAA